MRYGGGQLQLEVGGGGRVHWAGPSIGFDLGANASKVFVLVCELPEVDAIYRRCPAVDGSVYVVGAGINCQRLDGASVGYVQYRREKSLNPL